MICKMKKVSLVVLAKEKREALAVLADAEVFHTGRLAGNGEKLAELQNERGFLGQLMTYLPVKNKLAKSPSLALDKLTDRIKRTYEAKKEAEDAAITARREAARIERWANFTPSDIDLVQRECGYQVALYEVPKKTFYKEAQAVKAPLFVCGVVKGVVLVAAVAKDGVDLPAWTALELPKESKIALINNAKRHEESAAQFSLELAKLGRDSALIKRRLAVLATEIEFEQTLTAMGEESVLAYLTGYIPKSDTASFKALCAKHAWAAVMDDIADDDEAVPTKLKHWGVGAFVKPVLTMFDLTPGYREFDISFAMFFFFTIFFAMILGDAGYGAVLLLAALVLIIRKTCAQRAAPGFGLIYLAWLSTWTMVWGAVTGTWFGYAPFNGLPVLKPFIVNWMTNPDYIQFLCFFIGAVHLIIAHLWGAIRKLRTCARQTPAALGNLAMVAGLYFVVLSLLLKNPLPESFWTTNFILKHVVPGSPIPNWAIPLIGSGFVAVLLFGSQEKGKNPFVAAGLGMASFFPTFLSSISNLADIISYIRLYAVGLASLAIAQSFNAIALKMPVPVAIVILLLIHVFNIALSMLSVVVHGLRLNSLEFSSHLGLQWAGTPYKPFGAKK